MRGKAWLPVSLFSPSPRPNCDAAPSEALLLLTVDRYAPKVDRLLPGLATAPFLAVDAGDHFEIVGVRYFVCRHDADHL